ncbi:MAG: 3-hydroxyacyl-CoA dehydrogenase family protein, partial [Candidatus Bathyarchaeia archaeon]
MMGPFALMDLIGLDVVLAVEELWYKETGDPRDKPQKILVEKVKNQELGVKTGKGFYIYHKK